MTDQNGPSPAVHRAGWEAALAGELRDACPYRATGYHDDMPRHRAAWLQGYLDGLREREKDAASARSPDA